MHHLYLPFGRAAGLSTLALVIGCFSGGGGAFGGGGGGTPPSEEGPPPTSAPSSDPASSLALPLGITPPGELILDGQVVQQGQLNVTDATAYVGDPAALQPMDLIDTPVVKDATIGSSTPFHLLDLPGTTQVLVLVGFFRATVPPLPDASFEVTLFGNFGGGFELTLFLPANTDEFAYQVSTTSGEDAFFDSPVPEIPELMASGGGSVSLSSLPMPRSNVLMRSHGRARIFPPGMFSMPPTSDPGCGFRCGDGSCVDASVVCNGSSNCPDGSDEDSATCGEESSCCVATNGCPSETGNSCADTCCCCPGGQACCPNPADGCCASP